MARIILQTTINAPIDKCFDLARNIDVHIESTKHTNEKVIAGVTSGLINLNETVTWKARHFGIYFSMTNKITAFERPEFFVDEMIRGPFKYFRHEHYFEEQNGTTIMKDLLTFNSPFGIVGIIFDILILKRYLSKLIAKRNSVIRELAPS